MYERTINGKPVEFGVSGWLFNNNLLMYDRHDESLWDQATGTAVVGERAGERLTRYPFQILTWSEWKDRYPDSVVLSRDTGFDRDYDNWPYAAYETSDDVFYSVTASNEQRHPKDLVAGLEISGVAVAYLLEDLAEQSIAQDVIGEEPVLLVASEDERGIAAVLNRRIDHHSLEFDKRPDGLLRDTVTDSTWTRDGVAIAGPLAGRELDEIPHVRGFWFAWIAFHPDTELRRPDVTAPN